MNILLIILVFCVAILLLGNVQPTKKQTMKQKETGYKSQNQYNFDTSSVYGFSKR
jgi:hypothetical protein